MVDRSTKGQLLERPVIIPRDGLCLDGIYLRGTEGPPLVVASPHPRLGGSMTSPVVNELAYAAARAARASLRLDYRGVGASEGDVSEDPRDAAKDLRAGIDFLLETTGASSVALAGYSFGVYAALLAAKEDPRVDRLLLVAPPRRLVPDDGVPAYSGFGYPIVIVVGSDDAIADPAREQELAAASKTARVHVIPEAEHTFRQGLIQVSRLVAPFLGARGRDIARTEEATE